MTSNENNAPDINLDEFLPMPGAADILTAPPETKVNNTVFTKPETLTTDFLDKKEEKSEEEEEPKVDLEASAKVIDDLVNIDDIDDQKLTPGRPKIDKSGLVDTFSKLIDEGLLVPFDDEKSMEEYSMKDWKELIQANFEDRELKVRQEQTGAIIQQLPDELKIAYKYISDGGRDIKGLFKYLSQVEEVRALDPSVEQDQELIVKKWLKTSNGKYMSDDEIEEEINNMKDLGTLEKKALKYKPIVDKIEAEHLEQKLRYQENIRKENQEAAQQFMDNVYNTLQTGNLNGIKLSNKMQNWLYTELVEPKYSTATGRSNLLGHLLEHYQFNEPRYDLIAEALWLLADADGYKNQIRALAKNEVTQETVRKLKTEESRKIPTSIQDEHEREPSKRKLPRQQNIFKR